MAKQLIAERERVFVPERTIARKISGERGVWTETLAVTVQPYGIQQLQRCEIEKPVFGFDESGEIRRPDLLALLDGKPLAIEIRNTHAVDAAKSAWFKEHGYSVLEISVSDLGLLPPHELHESLERRLFEASAHSVWLSHVGDSDAEWALDEQERKARLAWIDQEPALIASLDAEEATRKRRSEFLERVRDVEGFKLRIGQSTLRVGRNASRVSLKVFGYAANSVFAATKAIARKHRGQFNSRARCWEFFRHDRNAEFFRLLCAELESIDRTGIRLGQDVGFDGPAMAVHAGTETPSFHSKPRHFDDPDLEESFQERAGILEFEAGYSRAAAEQLAEVEIGRSSCIHHDQ